MDGYSFGRRPFLAVLAVLALPPAARAQGRIDAEAVAGKPFGVARLTIPAGRGAKWNGDDFVLSEKSGRVLYPTWQAGPVRQLLRDALGGGGQQTVHFLFVGEQPLALSLRGPVNAAPTIAVRRDPRAHQRLLRSWWRGYTAPLRSLGGAGDYPPLVDNYLAAVLGRRLGLEVPPPLRRSAGGNEYTTTLSLLAGLEGARLDLERELLLADAADERADIPLPEELPVRPLELPAADGVAIEPLAAHVPAECLYVRFGSFENFQWTRERLELWGGDLRNLVAQRGVDYGVSLRVERQLGLKESALAKLLGPAVIADVALVGFDPFVREGAAIGILFQARANPALAADIAQQRQAAKGRESGATDETVQIGGRDVSLVSTSDHALRSFYVADGDFHLVTNCRRLVERFLEAGRGTGALADLPEFRHARAARPAAGGDAVFAFLSTDFFQNLIGPKYRVELGRRARAIAELELWQLARLAAAAEGLPVDRTDELVAAGLLPANFNRRADGSRWTQTQGLPIDSLRGGLGSFLPIPDVEITAISRAEAAAFDRFAQSYLAQWTQMDPITVALARRAGSGDGLEQVAIDLAANPLQGAHQEFLAQWIGPPTDERLRRVEGDLVAGQIALAGGNFFSGPANHIAFVGLRDADPRLVPDSLVGQIVSQLLFRNQAVQGYFGTWPEPGILRWLGGMSSGPPDAGGFSRLTTGVWRRQFEGFTVLSMHAEILAEVTPQLAFDRTDRPAQLWLAAGDLANSKLESYANELGYRFSRSTSLANVHLLEQLTQQLGVPRERALEVAESLLHAHLVCPLGGRYELAPSAAGVERWTSTALVDESGRLRESPPADYRFPALYWLRALDAVGEMDRSQLHLHAELEMPTAARSASAAPPPAEAAPPIISLPQLFGGAAAEAKSGTAPPPPPRPRPSAPRAAELPPPADNDRPKPRD